MRTAIGRVEGWAPAPRRPAACYSTAASAHGQSFLGAHWIWIRTQRASLLLSPAAVAHRTEASRWTAALLAPPACNGLTGETWVSGRRTASPCAKGLSRSLRNFVSRGTLTGRNARIYSRWRATYQVKDTQVNGTKSFFFFYFTQIHGFEWIPWKEMHVVGETKHQLSLVQTYLIALNCCGSVSLPVNASRCSRADWWNSNRWEIDWAEVIILHLSRLFFSPHSARWKAAFIGIRGI